MHRPLSRRHVLMAAPAVGAAALTTAACGDSGESDADITWWHINNEDPLMSLWEDIAAEWSEDSGLTFDIQPIANEDFKERIATSAQAGELPDLFQTWGGGNLAEQVEAGLVREVTDLDCLDKVNPIALEPYTIDGKLYAVPFDQGVVGFWYNKDLFAEAGIEAPPATWDEYLDAVQKLKDAGITPIALAVADKWPVHYYWTYLVMRIVGLDGLEAAAEAGDFSGEGFVRAGELFAELAAVQPFQEGHESATYGDVDGQAATMGEGAAAMELMGQWAPETQRSASGTDGIGDALGFFAFPTVEGGTGATTEYLGGGNGFAAGSESPDEITDFMCYILDEANQAREVEAGNLSTVAADPAAVVPDMNAEQQLVTDAMAAATGIQLYLDQAYPASIGSAINDASEGLVLGELTPQEFVDSVNEAWAAEQ